MSSNNFLREDGVYIQFGSKVWSDEDIDGDITNSSDCWFNVIKVIGDKMIIIGTSHYKQFFDININPEYKRLRLIKQCENCLFTSYISDDVNEPKIKYSDCFDSNVNEPKFIFTNDESVEDSKYVLNDDEKKNFKCDYNFYEYLNVDPTNIDPLNVVKCLEKVEWKKMLTSFYVDSISTCDLYGFNLYQETNSCDVDHLMVNDSNQIVSKTKDKFYLWYSPCTSQVGFDDCENEFEYVFIPWDLSGEEIWKEEYLKWKDRFNEYDGYNFETDIE